MIKIDKRRKYYMVFDTEATVFEDDKNLSFPLIYDIAYAICDKQGNIYEKANFIIGSIYYSKMMENAFFSNKRPLYDEMISNGSIEVKTFPQVMYSINKTISKYPNMTISAYNLDFDLRALRGTATLTKLSWYTKGDTNSLFWGKVEYQDLWGMAIETIYVPQKGFRKFIVEHDFFTEKGNPKSSAEIGYRYLKLDKDFVEDHMAMSDVLIEVQLLAHSIKQHKKYTKGILKSPFRKLFHMKKVA